MLFFIEGLSAAYPSPVYGEGAGWGPDLPIQNLRISAKALYGREKYDPELAKRGIIVFTDF